MDMEESEYELLRRKNIAEKNAFFQRLLPDLRACISQSDDEDECKTTETKPKKLVSQRTSRFSTPRARTPRVPVQPRRSVRIERLNNKLKRVKGFKGFRREKFEENTHKITVRFPWQEKLLAAKLDRSDGETPCESTANSESVTGIINCILNAINSNEKCDQCDCYSDSDTEYHYVCDETDDEDDDEDWDDYEQVVFYATTSEEDDEDSSEDSDEEIKRRPRVRRPTHHQIPSILPPEEITQKMLRNIAQSSGRKKYSTDFGTSCHQCRQKTLDTKTMCRSGLCVGVRGQFCGPCLLNRYGEKVSEALLDPNWSCPPCRGMCNCSICFTRKGRTPTGILSPFVKNEGYDSVAEYLLKEQPNKNVKIKIQRVVGYRETRI